MNITSKIIHFLSSLLDSEEFLSNLRLYIMRIMMGSSLCGVLLIWLNEYFFGTIDSVDTIAYPVFAIAMVLLLILLYIYPKRFRQIGATGFVIFAIYIFLYAYHTITMVDVSNDIFVVITYLQVISLMQIVLFIFLRGHITPTVASIMLIVLSGIIVFNVLGRASSAQFFSIAPSLVNIFILQGLQVAFLIAFAQIKDQYAQMRVRTEELMYMATVDYLTGIANRRHIENVIAHSFSYSPRGLAIIMLDIDHFKKINDTYGHDIGDQVLMRMTRQLREHMRSSDTLGRWGGEEFIVVAPNTDVEQAARLADRLRTILAEYTSDEYRLTASFGVAVYRQGDTPDSLVKRADKALYKAKDHGRNRVEVA